MVYLFSGFCGDDVIRLWSSYLYHYVVSYVGSNILEEYASSIFWDAVPVPVPAGTHQEPFPLPLPCTLLLPAYIRCPYHHCTHFHPEDAIAYCSKMMIFTYYTSWSYSPDTRIRIKYAT
jgi:hypothetical protein